MSNLAALVRLPRLLQSTVNTNLPSLVSGTVTDRSRHCECRSTTHVAHTLAANRHERHGTPRACPRVFAALALLLPVAIRLEYLPATAGLTNLEAHNKPFHGPTHTLSSAFLSSLVWDALKPANMAIFGDVAGIGARCPTLTIQRAIRRKAMATPRNSTYG